MQYRLYYAYFATMPCWTNYAVHTVSHIIACQACTIYRDTHHVLYRMSFAYPAARYIIYILYFHILYYMCLIHPDTVYILLNYNGLRILYETYWSICTSLMLDCGHCDRRTVQHTLHRTLHHALHSTYATLDMFYYTVPHYTVLYCTST